MSFKPVYTKQFSKDVKRSIKRGKNTRKLKTVLSLLIHGKKLPLKYKDHKLIGNLVGYRDCHIEPDWVLIYKVDGECIYFVRTGTHSELF